MPLETLCKQLLLYNNVRGEPLYPCTRILKFGVVRSPWERELSTYMHGKRGNFFKNDEYNKARVGGTAHHSASLAAPHHTSCSQLPLSS